nr:EF-hand domain-containing family member C2 [Equus asinus]
MNSTLFKQQRKNDSAFVCAGHYSLLGSSRVCRKKVGKEKFHKPQHWGFCNNVRMLMNEDKPGIGGELCLRQKRKPQYSAFLKEMGIDAPPWVAFDKQVLSFDAYLEDEVPEKSQENYRIRRYKIYFYLEDDTIQVNEPGVRNSGLPQGIFLNRIGILSSFLNSLPFASATLFSSSYLLTTDFNGTSTEDHCVFTSRKILASCLLFLVGQTQVTWIYWANVLFGLESTLASQRLYSLTKECLKHLGCCRYVPSSLSISPSSQMIKNFTSIDCKPPPPPKIERKFPPYTGFGSEEDSLRSCIGLVPTPHRKNFKKWMEKDSYGYISNTLRFFAKLITHDCADVDRLFVISYFLSDDTLSVFEPIERNSGLTGGMFLKRIRVKRPGQEVFKSELSEYIKAEELYVGARVNVNGYLFLLLNADEYTLNYMEKHSDKFPMSSIEPALQKLKKQESKSKELRNVFIAADDERRKMVDYNTFRDILMTLTVGELTDHEVITIARHYRVPEDAYEDVNVLIALAHERFKRNTFENFERLIANCVYQDRENKKVLPTKDIRRLCKSSRLPLTHDLLVSLLSKFEDSEGQINYESFFCALNWRINPVPELEPRSYLKERCEDEWLGMPSPIPVKYINYVKLLKEVFGLEVE